MQLHKNFLLLCATCIIAFAGAAQTVTDPSQLFTPSIMLFIGEIITNGLIK